MIQSGYRILQTNVCSTVSGLFSDMDERWLDIYVGGRNVVRILVELYHGASDLKVVFLF